MSLPGLVPGVPGVRAAKTATHKIIFYQGDWLSDLGLGRLIDGNNASDPSNSSPDQVVLQAGLLLGKCSGSTGDVTAPVAGQYGASVIDNIQGSLSSTGTSITVSAAGATEIVRRFGATGTFNLIGPPVASGTVRSLVATYSAVNTTTGVVTISAMGVNEVQTLGFTNSPAGTFTLTVIDLNGVAQTTAPITYSGTAATLVSNINTALNAALGASLVVASGSAVTAIALTFSGAGYAALPQSLVTVGSNEMTAGNISLTRTTAGVDGRFIANSFVCPQDGSQTPLTLVPDGYGILVTDSDLSTRIAVQFPQMPIAGVIDPTKIIAGTVAYASLDTSLQNWIKSSLSTASGGKFVFVDGY